MAKFLKKIEYNMRNLGPSGPSDYEIQRDKEKGLKQGRTMTESHRRSKENPRLSALKLELYNLTDAGTGGGASQQDYARIQEINEEIESLEKN